MATFAELVPDAPTGLEAVRELLRLPRARQLSALDELSRQLGPPRVCEAWNTSFGAGSLFDAWTRCPVTSALYEANRSRLAAMLARRDDWHVAEVGGGDGRLWQELLTSQSRGTLTVIDPRSEPHDCVRAVVPAGVTMASHVDLVQHVTLEPADAIVCSLTLHHVAGLDAEDRATHGLDGPGKLEVLQGFAASLRPRQGMLLLNEADVYCDLGLAPGDPILADRLLDSYVRRCAASLMDAIALEQAPDDLRARWWAIIRQWCIDQVAVYQVPRAERDVYELDVARWLWLLDRAGFEVVHHGYTDAYGLFCQYVCVPRS